MTIKIVTRPKKPSAGQSLGASVILPDIDLRSEHGRVKFLVHRRKPGIWYRVRSFDEGTKTLKLSTVHNKSVFPSKVDSTTAKNYVIVTEPEGSDVPGEAAIKAIQAGI